MYSKLNVSVDAVAAMRAQSGGREPDPVAVALLAEMAGAETIALQLREDRRTGQERDLRLLRETVKTRLDLRLTPAADLVATAFDARPDRVTVVAERRDAGALTRGLDVTLLKDALRKHLTHLRDAEVELAVRVDADLEQIKALHKLDVHVAVLDSLRYSLANGASERRAELSRLTDAALTASRLNLKVAIGGGLDLRGVADVARIPHVHEIQVGFACMARALLVGVERAVGDFVGAMGRRNARSE